MCSIMYVWGFSESLIYRAPEETVGSIRGLPWIPRRRQHWTLLGLRALEDAMVPQSLGVSQRQREFGSSLAAEGLLRRIVEVESLMQWLQY